MAHVHSRGVTWADARTAARWASHVARRHGTIRCSAAGPPATSPGDTRRSAAPSLGQPRRPATRDDPLLRRWTNRGSATWDDRRRRPTRGILAALPLARQPRRRRHGTIRCSAVGPPATSPGDTRRSAAPSLGQPRRPATRDDPLLRRWASRVARRLGTIDDADRPVGSSRLRRWPPGRRPATRNDPLLRSRASRVAVAGRDRFASCPPPGWPARASPGTLRLPCPSRRRSR